ncbi:MAG: hypothetical protein GX347_04410 [Epulopiscium sp.]|nr:hypothetical protein [Candidatus Epulonipiscium sp.]
MKRGSEYYTYGSSAHDLGQSYISSLQIPSEVTQPQIEQESKKRQKAKQRAYQKKSILYKLQLLACTILFFAGCLILMVGYSAISSQQANIAEMTKTLQELQKKNAMIQGEIGENMDLKKLEEKATCQLGMVHPNEHQLVYIDIPQNSYTVLYQPIQSDSTETSFLSSIFRFLTKVW